MRCSSIVLLTAVSIQQTRSLPVLFAPQLPFDWPSRGLRTSSGVATMIPRVGRPKHAYVLTLTGAVSPLNHWSITEGG